MVTNLTRKSLIKPTVLFVAAAAVQSFNITHLYQNLVNYYLVFETCHLTFRYQVIQGGYLRMVYILEKFIFPIKMPSYYPAHNQSIGY